MNNNDKKQLEKIVAIIVVAVFFIFVLPIFLYVHNSKGGNYSNADSLVKDTEQIEQAVDENQQTSEQQDKENNSVEENKQSSDGQERDLSDPFYARIREQLRQQRSISEMYVPKDYYPSDNYVKNATDIAGNLHVYKKKPILIYVPRGKYYDPITQAFVAYNNQFKGLIEFNTVKNPKKADIEILLTDDLSSFTDIGNVLGLGAPTRLDRNGNITHSEIKLLTKDYNKGDMPLTLMYNTVLHEIGHAIGIWGHSSNPGDVMYKAADHAEYSKLKYFSSRDIETLKIMYSGNEALIQKASNGAKQEKLQENIAYAQESNDADSYINVANSYYQNKQYDKALEAYKKALKLNPNNYRIYLGLADCYEKAKQYDYEITYAKYGLKKAQTNEQRAMFNQQIGYAIMMKGQYEDAFVYISNAYVLDPDNPQYFMNYIVLCRLLNKKDLAKDAYNNNMHKYDKSMFNETQMEILNWASE